MKLPIIYPPGTCFAAGCRLLTTIVLLVAASIVVSRAAQLTASDAPRPARAEAWLTGKLRESAEWYASDEALRIADNVLLCQRENGGWPMGKDLAKVFSDREKTAMLKQKPLQDTALLTSTEVWFLAKVYAASPMPRFREGILKGIDWMLAAQYPNGGWPKFWPDFVHADYASKNNVISRRTPGGRARLVTFNDGTMIGVMRVLDAVARRESEFAFVDEARRRKAGEAVARGVECILRCQVRVAGKPTVWANQYDEKTLTPRWARTFEPESLTGAESVGVVQFLMDLPRPNQEVVEAIEAAVQWFKDSRIRGIRSERFPDAESPRGVDVRVVKDPSSPGLWARYYEIGTNRPLFGDYDDEVHYTLHEISLERRTGYSWYGTWADDLLQKDYPAWKERTRATGR